MEQRDLLTSMIRDLRVKVEILKDDILIEEMYGIPTSGSITTAGNSNYRRTGQFTFQVLLSEKVLPNENSMIWFDKTLKISVGLIDNLSTNLKNDTLWFPLGKFAILNASFSKDKGSVVASINVGDLMSKLDGSLGGTVGTKVQILNDGVSIDTALKQTANQLGKVDIHDIIVNGNPAKVPYKIEQEPGSTVYQLMSLLTQLYKGYEIFFDINGYLVCQKIRSEEKDLVIWDFSKEKNDLRITNTNNFNLTNVKNSIVVWGRILDNGAQIYWRYRNRFLRRHINRTNYPDYDVIDIPFTYNLEIGDICHIEDILDAQEFVGNKSGTLKTCPIPENKKDRFKKEIQNSPRSYVWTNYFNYTETLMTNADGIIRASRWPSKQFDIIVKSISESSHELLATKQMDLATIGENDSRYFKITKINPTEMPNEKLQLDPDSNNKSFLFEKYIYNINDVVIMINGEVVYTGFKITNRNNRGIITFDTEKYNVEVYAKYSTFIPGGELYANKVVTINYEFQTDKPYWVELDFLVAPQFRMEELGEITKTINNTNSYNNTQAKLESEYELWSSSNFAEKISISCVPIYSMEVNRKIIVEDEETGTSGEYLVESFSTPLDISTPMSIEATKIYHEMVHNVGERNPLPNFAPDCNPTGFLYPPNITNGFIYNILTNVFTNVDLKTQNVKIYLTQKQIDELNNRLLVIPFDSTLDKEVFLNKASLIFTSLIFPSNMDREGFMSLFIDTQKMYGSIQSASTTGILPTDETTLKDAVENIHYIGKNSGYLFINYDLGKGNTYDKLLYFKKELPPEEYFARYQDESCENAWNNYPLPELMLPSRGFQDLPAKTTINDKTNGFMRNGGDLVATYEHYPHEYDVKVVILSHFCANVRISIWDLYRYGKMIEPNTLTNYPIVREDVVYLGAIPHDEFPFEYCLGMGNTKDTIEIIYRGTVINQMAYNPKLDNYKGLKGEFLINWKPVNNDYKVIVRITSERA